MADERNGHADPPHGTSPEAAGIVREKLREDLLLGTLRTKAVGLQYYDGGIEPGMEVILEREHGNPHDANAIRVESRDFEPAGHVPRRIAAWLAPLIDAGQVRADGRIGEGGPFRQTAPMELDLYLAPKGRALLRPERNPAAVAAAVHQVVLAIFLKSRRWRNPDVLAGLLESLPKWRDPTLLPASRMLLELLRNRSTPERARSGQDALAGVKHAVQSLRIEAAVSHGHITVIPMIREKAEEPASLLLADAIAEGVAEIFDGKPDGFGLGGVWIANRSPEPIFVPEGEVLVAGTARVTVQASFLVPPDERRHVGRDDGPPTLWRRLPEDAEGLDLVSVHERTHYASHRKEPDRNDPYAPKGEDGRGDENGSELLDRRAVPARYRGIRERLSDYREHLVLPDRACGVSIIHGNTFFSIDMVDHPRTLRAMWPRFLEACVLSCFEEETGPGELNGLLTDPLYTNILRNAIAGSLQSPEEETGLGLRVPFGNDTVSGSALWYDGRLHHLAARPAICLPEENGGVGDGCEQA